MKHIQTIAGTLGACIVPFVVYHGFYKYVWSREQGNAYGWLGFGISLAAGLAFVATLPVKRSTRFLIWLPYLVAVLFFRCVQTLVEGFVRLGTWP